MSGGIVMPDRQVDQHFRLVKCNKSHILVRLGLRRDTRHNKIADHRSSQPKSRYHLYGPCRLDHAPSSFFAGYPRTGFRCTNFGLPAGPIRGALPGGGGAGTRLRLA